MGTPNGYARCYTPIRLSGNNSVIYGRTAIGACELPSRTSNAIVCRVLKRKRGENFSLTMKG